MITSAGKIEHSGTISSTSKTQGLVNIQTTGTGTAADINSSGSINSNSALNIDSGNNLNVNAKEIIINNGSLASSPLIVNAKGNINLAADTRIMDDSQGGDVYIDAANINLAAGSELKVTVVQQPYKCKRLGRSQRRKTDCCQRFKCFK